jgi:alpha-2-macroglobulin
VPVTDAWAPGAYVTALMYRPMDEKAKRMPSRSIGLKWVELDKASRTIAVSLALPEKAASASRLTVPFELGGLAPGEPARIVVSAVDLGVLNVTRYETPAPEKYFFSQRRLGTEIRDLYGKLIDGMRAEKGRIRTGGDGGTGLSMSGSPQAEKPLSLFSGLVIPSADGTAKIEFDLPEFNGTVRVSAIAWSAGKVGSTKGDVIVRDPLALLVTAPRFMTLGDDARLQVDLHNIEGQAGAFKVTVSADFAGTTVPMIERDVQLAAGERRSETLPLKADRLARTTYVVRVTGPHGPGSVGNIDVGRRIALDVKPPGGDVRRSTVSLLKASGGKISLSPDLLADMIPDRAKITLSVGPAAGFDVAGLLLSLDRYPHGCAEQTTSRAMPLVYLNEMAKLAGLKQDEGVKERVQKAIDRLWEMQESSGAFGIWGPRNGDLWLTAYVSDFLTRAKESGYVVQARPFAQALDKLANSISGNADFKKGGEDIAYALYVLARNGRAPVGELRYFADTKIEEFATPLARTQIGAALGMLGDKERSERAFKSAMTAFDGINDTGYRADYGSTLRDGAAMLTLASEVGFARAETPKLATLIGKALSARTYTSTQEQAWMLLASRSMLDEAKRAALTINGTPHQGALVKTYDAADLRAGHVIIANTADTDTTAVVTVTGDAATPEPAASRGFKIERSYFTLDGKPVVLASGSGGTGSLTQNQRLIAVVKVVPEEAKEGRIIVVDRLPAGLEIENPRLIDGANLKSMPWLDGVRTPEHAEFRDDRFVAALDLSRNASGDDEKKAKSSDTLTFAYMIRAVTPGSFLHPAATVEDMYRPERFARTASGRLEVKAAEVKP